MHMLQTPEVRALAWSCFGEHWGEAIRSEGNAGVTLSDIQQTLNIANFPLTDQRQQWLRQLDAEPAPLIQYLQDNCRSTRIGLLFEALWHFFLHQDPETDLLSHNLPIREAGRTLGELDIVYFCHRRQQNIHLELAVKFYLATDAHTIPSQPLSRWLGPECRDRMDLKVGRLLQHQLQLPHTPQGKAVLDQLGISNLSSELWLKGKLFEQWSGGSPSQRWLPLSQLQQLDNAEEWRLLEKPDWLAQVPSKAGIKAPEISAAELPRPRMLYRLTPEQEWQNGLNSPAQHCMVTPDIWPHSGEAE